MPFLTLLIPDAGPNHQLLTWIGIQGLGQEQDLPSLNPTVLIQQCYPRTTSSQGTLNTTINTAGNATTVAIEDQLTVPGWIDRRYQGLRIVIHKHNEHTEIRKILQIAHQVVGNIAKQGHHDGMKRTPRL
jgi:hypothetical protein